MSLVQLSALSCVSSSSSLRSTGKQITRAAVRGVNDEKIMTNRRHSASGFSCSSNSRTYQPLSHCHYCGNALDTSKPIPRKCSNCQQNTYRNPIPVAVALVPIEDGVLCIRRGNPKEPGFGKIALPGGYMDYGESWQRACARELFEELSIQLKPEDFDLHHVASSSNGGSLLVFGRYNQIPLKTKDLPPFESNLEVTERLIVTPKSVVDYGAEQFAFPTHLHAVQKHFFPHVNIPKML